MLRTALVVLALSAEPRSPVVQLKDAPRYAIGDKGAATLFWNAENGSSQVSLGTLELKVGAAVPEHVHEASGEWLSVVRGEVEFSLEGVVVKARAGDAIYVPMGKKHSAKVIGAEPFVAVQVYSPAGPEQRFVKGAADAGR